LNGGGKKAEIVTGRRGLRKKKKKIAGLFEKGGRGGGKKEKKEINVRQFIYLGTITKAVIFQKGENRKRQKKHKGKKVFSEGEKKNSGGKGGALSERGSRLKFSRGRK